MLREGNEMLEMLDLAFLVLPRVWRLLALGLSEDAYMSS